MIKEVEYNDGESRLVGHVEAIRQSDNTWTVTCFLEDKIYGQPWEFIAEENVVSVAEKQKLGVLKALKKMAEDFKTKSGYDKLQEKGFSAQ